MFPPPEIARIQFTKTPPAEVHLLGHPALRGIASAVEDFSSLSFHDDCAVLVATLERFRSVHGFGRAISAPQIGIPRRLIALDLGSGPFLICNPLFTRLSTGSFTLWDDCMSFPWLLVRVRRHLAVSLRFADYGGTTHSTTDLDPSTSELLQHEVDHLDGILAIDRALDTRSVIARAVYQADPLLYDGQVNGLSNAHRPSADLAPPHLPLTTRAKPRTRKKRLRAARAWAKALGPGPHGKSLIEHYASHHKLPPIAALRDLRRLGVPFDPAVVASIEATHAASHQHRLHHLDLHAISDDASDQDYAGSDGDAEYDEDYDTDDNRCDDPDHAESTTDDDIPF